MQFITFLTEFIKHPKNIGAVSPSSKKLAKKIVEAICFKKAQCIVELGPGTGSFTKELMKRKAHTTKLILIENNTVFYNKLRQQYGHEPNVIIIYGSAENLGLYMKNLNIETIDYIVSGLPFTSLNPVVASRILQNVKECLEEGEFITFQYSLVKKSFIQQFFDTITHEKVWINLPPAYVLNCRQGTKRVS